jgi:ankyrin repeat protein
MIMRAMCIVLTVIAISGVHQVYAMKGDESFLLSSSKFIQEKVVPFINRENPSLMLSLQTLLQDKVGRQARATLGEGECLVDCAVKRKVELPLLQALLSIRGINLNALFLKYCALKWVIDAFPSSEIDVSTLVDEYGNTVLHNMAMAKYACPQLVAKYIEAHAPVDQANNAGNRPIHCAVMQGKVALIKALVDAGADVNAPANLQNTALHIAAGREDSEVVQQLVNLKAYVGVCNQDKLIPLEVALLKDPMSPHSLEIAKILFDACEDNDVYIKPEIRKQLEQLNIAPKSLKYFISYKGR